MIITDNFSFIHVYKTGGTFVDNTLKDLYFKYPNLKFYYLEDSIYKCHCPYSKIPEQYKNLPVLSIIRNPFDWYVSIYFYGSWWRNQHKEDIDWLSKYINKPFDVPIKELIDRKSTNISKSIIFFFSKNIEESMKEFENDPILYVKEKKYKTYFFDKISWIHQENLNEELINYLLNNCNFDHSSLEFIRDKPKILPFDDLHLRKKEHKWETFFDKELIEYVKEKDSLVFDMFPEYIN